MTFVDNKIWLALKSHIESLPATVNLPKAWPGELFEQAHTTYLRVGLVSTPPENVMIDYGKGHVRTGALILTLVAPMDEKLTTTQYKHLVGMIAEHFIDGTKMRYNDVCVTVTDYPSVQAGYEGEGYWSVPVNIPWRTYA